jgi:hypothetical protein
MSATFNPPTQLQSTQDWFWGRYSIPVGISVIKQSGTYVQVPTPTHDELVGAGTEGTDWFRGGYVYTVSDAVATALTADGFGSYLS